MDEAADLRSHPWPSRTALVCLSPSLPAPLLYHNPNNNQILIFLVFLIVTLPSSLQKLKRSESLIINVYYGGIWGILASAPPPLTFLVHFSLPHLQWLFSF